MMKNRFDFIIKYIDEIIPEPKMELNYTKDYELLIAVMLSAQSTDKRVNIVTSVLFDKYKTIYELDACSISDIIEIIKSNGTYRKKSEYVKNITRTLIEKSNGHVINDRKLLESIPGVGHKTANVVLSILFDEPCIAVDTHISRVSKRLGLANENDNVVTIEKKLSKLITSNHLLVHHQLLLFGRYFCKSRNPLCNSCKLKEICKNYKDIVK